MAPLDGTFPIPPDTTLQWNSFGDPGSVIVIGQIYVGNDPKALQAGGYAHIVRCKATRSSSGTTADVALKVLQRPMLEEDVRLLALPRSRITHSRSSQTILINRELQCSQSLKHRFILPYIGMSMHLGRQILLSPYMENGHLGQYLARDSQARVDHHGLVRG